MDVTAPGLIQDAAPPGARCSRHPDRPAPRLCPRCGGFACQACWQAPRGLCAACARRVALLPDLDVATVLELSWRLYTRHAALWIAQAVIVSAVASLAWGGWYLASILVAAVQPEGDAAGLAMLGLFAAFQLATLALSPWVYVVNARLALGSVRGAPSPRDLLPGAAAYGWALLASLVLGGLYLLGFALAIVPGLLVMALTVFWSLVLVDRRTDCFSALGASARLASGRLGRLILLGVTFMALHLAGYLACCFPVLFITLPLSQIAQALVYDHLLAARGEEGGAQRGTT